MTQVDPRLSHRILLRLLPDLALFRTLADAPGTFVPFLVYSGALFRRTTLTARERELVILRVAVLSDSPYEWAQHEPIALQAGVTAAELQALQCEIPDAPSLQASDRVLLGWTDSIVTSRPTGAPPAEQSLCSRQMTELAQLVGHYMTVARIAQVRQLAVSAPATAQLRWPGRWLIG